jgi:hypothetical protein
MTTYRPTMSLKIHSLPFRHYLPHLWARLGIPLLLAMTKMISTVHSVAQVIVRHNRRSQPLHYSPSLSRLYQSTSLLLRLPSIYLQLLPYACPSSSQIRLPEPLKPVTSILVEDNVTNNTFLLFFFSSHALALCFSSYLSEHEFTCRSTRVTKHMSNMCLPHGKHTFASYLPHV